MYSRKYFISVILNNRNTKLTVLLYLCARKGQLLKCGHFNVSNGFLLGSYVPCSIILIKT